MARGQFLLMLMEEARCHSVQGHVLVAFKLPVLYVSVSEVFLSTFCFLRLTCSESRRYFGWCELINLMWTYKFGDWKILNYNINQLHIAYGKMWPWLFMILKTWPYCLHHDPVTYLVALWQLSGCALLKLALAFILIVGELWYHVTWTKISGHCCIRIT